MRCDDFTIGLAQKDILNQRIERMRAIDTYKGYTILQNGCCGDITFAIARPNGIIFERNLETLEQVRTIIDACILSAQTPK